MAAGLLRKKAISEQWRFEVQGEVRREWVEGGRGGAVAADAFFRAVVILGEVAYRQSSIDYFSNLAPSHFYSPAQSSLTFFSGLILLVVPSTH